MFKVHINDGETPIPDDDIYYIVAKEGIFLKKKMGIMESIAPVSNISILESVNTMAKMNIKKIPGGQFANVISFFKEVYQQFHGESIVLLFYNEEKRVYKIVPPHQKVTAAACDYNKGITIEGFQMIGTIHSHAAMSAFHSGVDDKDELHFDGLHITVGNVNEQDVSITASIVANGSRFVVQPDDYIDRLQIVKDIDEIENIPSRKIYKWIDGKLIEDQEETNKFVYQHRRFDKRYLVNVSQKFEKFPSDWMSMVEKGTYTPKFYNNKFGSFNFGNWGQHYDSDLWKQYSIQNPQNPLNVGPAANITPITFPSHDIQIEGDNQSFPCKTCVFRTYKFLEEESGSDDEPTVYECEKCKTIVIEDIDDNNPVICPTCKTDDYLNEIENDELPNRYIKEEPFINKNDNGHKVNSQFIECKICGSSFHLFSGEYKCPFCGNLVNEEKENFEASDMMEQQFIEDSGDMLCQEFENANNLAIIESKKENYNIEKIPEPNTNVIPISENKSLQEGDNNLFQMFRKVFGRRK